MSCQIRVFRGRDSEGNQLTLLHDLESARRYDCKKAESELNKFAASFKRL